MNEQEKTMQELIAEVLDSFRIRHGEISMTAGPSVTLFEFRPEIGVRMSKIRNLKDEFSIALQSAGVRVIAPMPGKGTVGIEVPNKERQIVPVSNLIYSDAFTGTDKILPLALGKTVTGDDFIADLTDMPHLLIAGATGQGKSVGLNVIITSLLSKCSPDELKLILVDPKQVELSVYEDITRPYLMHVDGLNPICTQPDEAQLTLDGVIGIMEERYSWLKKAGVRNIQEYNRKNSEKMPYIVVIIDEYGDLVLTADSVMEHSICRLAQKARAVGIHLIISTQRPDVSIVTGNIKANFPTRIAFRTTTGTDSRVILDRNGAERLQGKGDMLFFSGADTVRVQCAYISTEEVSGMCADIKERYPDYPESLIPMFEDVREDDIQKQVEEARRVSLKPYCHTEDIALWLSRQSCYRFYHNATMMEELHVSAHDISASILRLEEYGVVGPLVRDDAGAKREILIRNTEKIKEIINYYSA